ncbi:DNA-(apurinic or apyrimidinic site) endonuclease 2-like [Paramacrobiotus metropolitanus]|uniref:DNA-(apurinic or apyrimidinic site) endonuclease 2-like n=1 Tax=Paramacrobiotus metropolitanus TaxID=2943436 RepID=UPI002445B29C|nr:DNA-(apurinic or apyrimidinic site) endonuclease 2-like [Paramacrobiotus metropolitanus]
MKIVTWNINGIRATSGSLKALLDSLDADIICLQETKITREMQTASTALVDGYNAYFSYSRKRAGYSGVVNYCRDRVRPVAAEEGLSGYLATANGRQPAADTVGCYGNLTDFPDGELKDLDGEGRTVITEHQFRDKEGRLQTVCVINVYCPHIDKERDDRKAYKANFFACLQKRAEALLTAGKHVIIVGDLNTSHRPIDTCDSWTENPYRLWMNDFLLDHSIVLPASAPSSEDGVPLTCENDKSDTLSQPPVSSAKFTDAFRYFQPTTKCAYTCWSTSTGARHNNYGCRLDYIIADNDLIKTAFVACEIRAEIQGSDHCPVRATLGVECIAAEKCPSLCTKYMPEFQGKQQTLHAFFRSQTVTQEAEPSVKKLKLTETVITTNKLVKSASLNVTKSKGQMSLTNFFGKRTDVINAVVATNPVEASVKAESPASPDVVCLDTCSSQSSGASVVSDTTDSDSDAARIQWQKLLKGPRPPPTCHCGQACIMKKVNKKGPNKGKQFYLCSKPPGVPGDPNARCNFFRWI